MTPFFAGHGGRRCTKTRGEVATTCLPREAVPYDYQAFGPFVSRGDPAPVFTDAEAGDDVGVALQTWREVALRQGLGGAQPWHQQERRGPGGTPELPFQMPLAENPTPTRLPWCFSTARGFQTSPQNTLRVSCTPCKNSGFLGVEAYTRL